MSAERRKEIGAMKETMHSVVGPGKASTEIAAASTVQSTILNQLIGKSMTELDS